VNPRLQNKNIKETKKGKDDFGFFGG